MGYVEILKLIPFSMITNFILFFLLIMAIKMNPNKIRFTDLWNFIKGRYYKSPSIHRLISVDGTEKEIVLSKIDTTITKVINKKTHRYIMNPLLTTRRNKIPIYTHIENNSLGVNFFKISKANDLNSQVFENVVTGAKATADTDFFNQLWAYKHVIKFIGIIAIASCVGAFFGFQILNEINTLEICKIPGSIL